MRRAAWCRVAVAEQDGMSSSHSVLFVYWTHLRFFYGTEPIFTSRIYAAVTTINGVRKRDEAH